MTIDAYGQWMGTPMEPKEIDTLLDTEGYGILSLAVDNEPYSIPVSFGYDDGVVYFAFIRDSPDNRKFEFIADGKVARLLVTDIRARFDWQSIAVTGPVEAISLADDEWDTLIEALEDNAWFSTDFERSAGVEGVQGWRLAPDEIRGLEVTPQG
jgi:nitroimidazol reductase NimA-like FMN-containing flavoprotein (pyridoxamine 5'-phosphate oxidase superfamily)